MNNILLDTALDVLCDIDAYKLSHIRQYPPKTQRVYSNWTNRGSRVVGVDHTVNFGLQGYIKQVLIEKWGCFFAADIDEVIALYQKRCDDLLGVGAVNTDHIRDLHALGFLPLEIRSLPEGQLVPCGVPCFTIENTDDRFFWLTNYLETSLSAHLWQGATSATTAWHNRRMLNTWAKKTGADIESVAFQGHDFSARGLTGLYSAQTSGAGHLLSFTGSDTLSAVNYIDRYYNPQREKLDFVASSVPATEHSVMCAGGKDHEQDTYERLLDTYPTGILAVVSDTWNLWNVLQVILPNVKDKIMARDGKLVIRPDSGDPETILCGDVNAPEGSPENLGVVQMLWDIFGGIVNDQGFKVLDSHIGTIYGDSITYDRANSICQRLYDMGFTSTTVTFGFGSYTYQGVTRDTFKSAMKATWVQIDGQGMDIFKDPITDDGTKKSATGRLAVDANSCYDYFLIQQVSKYEEGHRNCLETVFKDGKLLYDANFRDIQKTLRGTTRKLESCGVLSEPLKQVSE